MVCTPLKAWFKVRSHSALCPLWWLHTTQLLHALHSMRKLHPMLACMLLLSLSLTSKVARALRRALMPMAMPRMVPATLLTTLSASGSASTTGCASWLRFFFHQLTRAERAKVAFEMSCAVCVFGHGGVSRAWKRKVTAGVMARTQLRHSQEVAVGLL